MGWVFYIIFISLTYRLQPLIEHLKILLEKSIPRDMKNSKGDEERRSDVYGIMEVSHEHNGAEADGCDDENVAKSAAFPENESHEEGQAGVAREEQVIAESESFEESRCGAVVNASGYWSEMGQGDETGTDDDEKGSRFEDKGNDFRLLDAERADEEPQQYRSINSETIDVKDGNVVKNEIGHRITGAVSGVEGGIKVDGEANEKHNQADADRGHELFIF
jgi:hypothetical protein